MLYHGAVYYKAFTNLALGLRLQGSFHRVFHSGVEKVRLITP